jgi:CheY-like chemotaxis protein
VLAISATGQRGEREACLAAGITECLARPVRFDELQALLHGWLLAKGKSEKA